MGDTMAKSCRPFSNIIICNIKSRAYTNLEKLAENPYFCINYANYAQLITRNMSDTKVKSWRLFSNIIICNIKSLVPNLRKWSLPKCCPGMPKSYKAQYLENRSNDFHDFFSVSSYYYCLSKSKDRSSKKIRDFFKQFIFFIFWHIFMNN